MQHDEIAATATASAVIEADNVDVAETYTTPNEPLSTGEITPFRAQSFKVAMSINRPKVRTTVCCGYQIPR